MVIIARRLVGTVVLALVLAGYAPNAEAKPKVALDAEAAIALQPDRVSSGYGGAVRLGYELDATLLSLTPEIGGSYHGLGGELGPNMVRGFGGARLALGALVRPGVYAHAGYAHVGYAETSRDAATYDAGLFLDLTALPALDLGLHAGYAMIPSSAGGASIHWLAAGAHVAFVF